MEKLLIKSLLSYKIIQTTLKYYTNQSKIILITAADNNYQNNNRKHK